MARTHSHFCPVLRAVSTSNTTTSCFVERNSRIRTLYTARERCALSRGSSRRWTSPEPRSTPRNRPVVATASTPRSKPSEAFALISSRGFRGGYMRHVTNLGVQTVLRFSLSTKEHIYYQRGTKGTATHCAARVSNSGWPQPVRVGHIYTLLAWCNLPSTFSF